MTNKQKQVLMAVRDIMTNQDSLDIFTVAEMVESKTGIDRGYIFRTISGSGIVRKQA